MALLRQNDPSLLLPSFWQRLEVAMSLTRARGYHPVLWETKRSMARTLLLVAKGTGSKNTLHRFGAAADVICGSHAWGCKHHKCRFFQVWGECAADAGLSWGGLWKSRPDSPHVQICKPELQARFRALPEAERDAFAAACMRGEEP